MTLTLNKFIIYCFLFLIASSILGGPLGLIFHGERHLLLLAISLACIMLIYIKRNNLYLDLKSYPLAITPVIFFAMNSLWAFPWNSGQFEKLPYAISDIQSLVILPILSIFFILFVNNSKKLNEILKLIVALCLLLALFQSLIWLGLRFDLISQVAINQYLANIFGTYESVNVLFQPSNFGFYIRIIWISSYWLVFGVFILPLIFRNPLILLFGQFIFGIAIIASYTRGIWLGLIFGLALCSLLLFIRSHLKFPSMERKKLLFNWLHSLVGLFLSLIFVLCLDTYQGNQKLMMSRVSANSINLNIQNFSINNNENEVNLIPDESINERKLQSLKLIEMWKHNPLFGHGYGSFVEDHIRHAERPFIYEMVPFALLMKLGIVGFLIYISFFIFVLIRLLLLTKYCQKSIFIFSGLFAFLIQIHTNPVFYSFTGVLILSIFLYIWLLLEYKNYQ